VVVIEPQLECFRCTEANPVAVAVAAARIRTECVLAREDLVPEVLEDAAADPVCLFCAEQPVSVPRVVGLGDTADAVSGHGELRAAGGRDDRWNWVVGEHLGPGARERDLLALEVVAVGCARVDALGAARVPVAAEVHVAMAHDAFAGEALEGFGCVVVEEFGVVPGYAVGVHEDVDVGEGGGVVLVEDVG